MSQLESEKSTNSNQVQELKAEIFGLRNELKESYKKQKKVAEQINKNFTYRINAFRK